MVPTPSGSERERFRWLFEERRDELYRFLHRLAGNSHDAEDLLQETFARLWRKRYQFRGDGSVGGYLRRIAFRVYLNARTRLGRVRAVPPLDHDPPADAPDPAELAADSDDARFLRRAVRGAIDALPDSWREPFLLFRYEGLTCAQVADVMGITPKAVEMRLRKAMQALSASLERLRADYGGRS